MFGRGCPLSRQTSIITSRGTTPSAAHSTRHWTLGGCSVANPAGVVVRVEGAHPAIVSKRQFQRVTKLLGSRAPKKVHPRRSASPYLLSGLLRCETCGKAMTAAEAKSGKYTYYVCHSLLKRGSGTCKTPRLNAKSFEKLIVDELRANVLTESNIRDLVKLLTRRWTGWPTNSVNGWRLSTGSLRT